MGATVNGPALRPVRAELVLGGQRSGKSRRAEAIAAAWLAASPGNRATMVATATAHDAEMRARIAQHRADRALRLPAMATAEEPVGIAEAIGRHSAPDTLVVVDCLTLWLTNLLFARADGAEADGPSGDAFRERNQGPAQDIPALLAPVLIAIERVPGPVVLVSNEIGLGVVPMGREVRAFVDALGLVNQRVAQACDRVTLMAAGLPLHLKGGA